MSTVLVNQDSINSYFDVVFSDLEGFIPIRNIPEHPQCTENEPFNRWLQITEAKGQALVTLANYAAQSGKACFVIPGTVCEQGQAKADDIKQMQTLLVDLDTGDIKAKKQHLETCIGEPTLIVESGGITHDSQKKLHLYWQLSEPAEDDELKTLLHLRHQIALKVGGDIHFQSAHQPIRLAGSIHQKTGELNEVIIQTFNPKKIYHLPDLQDAIENMAAMEGITISEQTNPLDFNNADSKPSTEQALSTPVREGGQDEFTRFQSASAAIGHYVRQVHKGVMSMENAWEAMCEYNQAILRPPWPEERLQQEAKRLWDKHCNEHGKPVVQTTSDITSIDPTQWQGIPPEREWIINNWLPKGCVTAIYGDGGMGKSLIAQQLMTCVATGIPWFDIHLTSRRVYGLMCEDDEDELWRRQISINQHYQLDMSALSDLRFVSRVGDSNLLMTFDGKDTGRLTEFYNALLQDILEFDAELIVLDTAADVFGGNENNRTQVRQFIQNACARIARDTGGAVLLCAHPSDSGITKGTGTGGSTAWNNTVRSRWYLTKSKEPDATPNDRLLSRKKSNYAQAQSDIHISWSQGAFTCFYPEPQKHSVSQPKHSQKFEAEWERKQEMIIKTLRNEAAVGHVYVTSQFARKFQYKNALGSERSIKNYLKNIETQGQIMLFANPEDYKLPKLPCNALGYLWVEGMCVPELNTDEFVLVKPTHFLCSQRGTYMRIEDENEETNHA